MRTPPPDWVVRSFGIGQEPVAIEGGEGVSYRAGPIVLKRVHDVREAAWIQELLAHIDPDGFRVPEPVPAADGSWTVDSWSASRFIEGLQPVAPRWDRVIDWGLRFGEAADRALPDRGSPFGSRTHRWAVADRVAWGEAAIALSPAAIDVHDEIAARLLEAPSGERRFVHGDLAGNVFVDRMGCPVLLDVSPYLRDARWAAAIVVGDAVLWRGADVGLVRDFATDERDRDLLGRALTFRLVAEQLASDPRHGAWLEPFRRVLRSL